MSPSLEAMACRALSSSRFAELLATANLCVLDVRPFLQYNKGHVRDAINVPMSGLTLRRIARNGLGDFLTQEVKERMLKASTVVLYDAQTEDVNQEPPQTHTPSALKIMMDALDSRAVTVFFLCGKSQWIALDVFRLMPVWLILCLVRNGRFLVLSFPACKKILPFFHQRTAAWRFVAHPSVVPWLSLKNTTTRVARIVSICPGA